MMSPKNTWHIQAFLAGLISLATQTAWLRTAFFLFDGNEMLTGLYLALWMLFTGAGALLGQRLRFDIRAMIIVLFGLMTFLPLLCDYLAILLRNRIFIAGTIPPIQQVAAWLAVWLLPFCLLSGILFTQLSRQASGTRIYGMEAAGAATGGLLTLIQVLVWPSASLLHLIIAVAGTAGGLLGAGRKYILTGVPLLFLTAFIWMAVTNPVRRATASLYPGQSLLRMQETPHGRLSVTNYYGQSTVFLNGIPLAGSGPAYETTANLHFAMLQRPNARRLLVIGGASGHLFNETGQYPGLHITVFEPNPSVLPYLTDTAQIKHQDVRILTGDPFPLIKANSQAFDIILLNNAPPDNLSLNRFLTVECFGAIKSSLTPDGLFCCTLPAIAQYGSDGTLYLYAIVYNTLREVFSQVRLIHGPMLWLQASDAALATNLWQEAGRAYEPAYVNPEYFSPEDLQRREEILMGQMNRNAPVNTLLKPLAFAAHLKFWTGMTQSRPALVFVPIVLILALLLYRRQNHSRLMFAAGYTASAGQLLLLFLLQTLLGNIYLLAGMVFGIFMAGLAAGTLMKAVSGLSPRAILLLMGTTGMVLPLPFILISSLLSKGIITAILILALTFVLSFLTGWMFRACMAEQKSSPAGLYSSDLAGASAGMLLTGLWLLPAVGLVYTSLFTGMVCMGFAFSDRCPLKRKILFNFEK